MSEPGRHIPETKQEEQNVMLFTQLEGLALKGTDCLILLCTEALGENFEVF